MAEQEKPRKGQAPNKTQKKKQTNQPSEKSTNSNRTKKLRVKNDLESVSTSKRRTKSGSNSTNKSQTEENESDEWDVDDTEREGNVVSGSDLPDYVAKFGIEEVKKDRFKLNVPHTNLQHMLIDEIALEGLDGITIEALWTRLSIAVKEPLPFPDNVKRFFWNVICLRKDLEFYKLQEPRRKLVIYDRFENIDPDLGATVDPVEAPFDIYPYHPVKEKDVFGSAITFGTRENITNEVKELMLEEAESRYGSQLVIVAMQKVRMNSIMYPLSDPCVELTSAQYCLLERIGRARVLGEITQGKVSLQTISKDPKVIFYNRKILIENKLVNKQAFFMRTHSAQRVTGSLLHLIRFYNQKKSVSQIMTEQIVEVLRKRPMYRMEYGEVKKVFGNIRILNKLFRTVEFQRYVKTGVLHKYRELHPNATVKEWKQKGSDKEKQIRTIDLVNPSINVGGSWNEDEPKEESSDEEETKKEMAYNTPLLHQIYHHIKLSGAEGRSLKEIQASIGMDFYTVRAAVNIMINQNLIAGVKIDMGRQRIIKYHALISEAEDGEEFTTKAHITESSHLEKDSLEFLSDFLEIDPELLKRSPTSNIHEISRTPTPTHKSSSISADYVLIKQLREQNKQTKSENRDQNMGIGMGNESILRQQLMKKQNSQSGDAYDVSKEGDAALKTATGSTSQKDLNLSALDKIFKNQHSYNVSRNSLTPSVASDVKLIKSENSVEGVYKTICSFSNSVDASCTVKSRKRKKVHKRILRQIRQTNQPAYKEQFEASPSVEEILKNMQCPLSLFAKNVSYERRYHKLRSNLTKIIEPLLARLKYKIRMLMPKKRYMCKQKVTKAEYLKFSQNHPLLSLDNPLTDIQKQADRENQHQSLFDSLNLKRKLESAASEDAKRRKLNDPSSSMVTSPPSVSSNDIFMGPNPILSYYTVDEDNIETTVLISTKPEEFNDPGSKYIKDHNATVRTLKRASYILEAIHEEKVITDITRLHKMIQTKENEEGYKTTMDKKSILRIYTRLVRGGHIKILQVILKSAETRRSVTVLCDPSLDIQHSIIESVIEQLKMKFFVLARRKDWDSSVTQSAQSRKEVTAFDTSEITCSVGELKLLSNNDSLYTYNRHIGKEYGYIPKFARMRVMHEFLFYLIYSYPYGEEVPDVVGMLEDLQITVEDDVLREMPPIYCKEISWKMFIPPMPKHSGWPDGWALVCDVLLRLPLSLFVKIFNVTFVIPELPAYLEHPIRQHYLVKHLPSDIRNGLLHQRKYIFSIHETFARLCYIGILQFGPQKLREKDQLFIYLNRHGTLRDTTTSNAGYHYVEDKDYKELHYHFATAKDVETYWYEMWNISTHSNLGLRSAVTGTYITIEQVETKPAMLEAMKPQTAESAILNDDGHVPGDRRGAAGLDSALWSHIKRNWLWGNRSLRARDVSRRESSSDAHKKQKGKLGTKTKKKKSVKLPPPKTPDVSSEKNQLNPVTQSCRRTYKKIFLGKHQKTEPSTPAKQSKSYVRKVMPRVEGKKKKDYDIIDKRLMEHLKQSRSEWTDGEDRILQICKIVAVFLCPNCRKQAVAYTVIRDVLHKLSPCSTNKTSGACMRRLLVIFGTADHQEYLQQIVKTLCLIPFVRKYFQRFCGITETRSSFSERQLNGSFVYLVTYFYKHQHEIQHIFEAISQKYRGEVKTLRPKAGLDKEEASPSTAKKSNIDVVRCSTPNKNQQGSTDNIQSAGTVEVISYDCSEFTKTKTKAVKLYDESAVFPQTEKDIILDTIKSIIHSTVGIKQDDISWVYQLFQVYQNYPDDMLKAAMTEIRNSQMVAVRRTHTKKTGESEGLPTTTKSFQFSFYYCFTQITNFPPELFLEAHEVFLGIMKHKEALMATSSSGLPMESFEQGHAVGLAEIAVHVEAYFNVDIPREVLILNPNVTDHTELIKELAVRYKKMLIMVKQGIYFKDYDSEETSESCESTQGHFLHTEESDSVDQVDFSKQEKTRSVPRTPMIQRFLKSWFLAEEPTDADEDLDSAVNDTLRQMSLLEERPVFGRNVVMHPADADMQGLKRAPSASSAVAQAQVKKPEESSKSTTVKPEKRKKRPTQMIPEESIKILEALKPQLHSDKPKTQAEVASEPQSFTESSTHQMADVHQNPIVGNASGLSFEDYEKKLESLLSTKLSDEADNLQIPEPDKIQDSEITANDGKEVSFVIDDFSENDSNILEKYLHSKRNSMKKPVVVADIVDYATADKNHLTTENETVLENTDSDPATSARIQYLMNDELTVEQIMEQMLVECPPEERKVPKPTSLARLLVKGLFPELDEDEERLERLHQHFLSVCPDTNLLLADAEDNEEMKYISLQHSYTCKELLKKVQMDIITSDNRPVNNEFLNKLKNKGSSDLDIFVAESLVEFVRAKHVFGASMKQIKEHFANFKSVKLSSLLKALTDMNVIMRTGISYLVYVHYKYRKHWLVQSCTLGDQDKLKLRESNSEESAAANLPSLAKSLESYAEIKVKIAPWARIDGTLNLKVFERWMCTVLGHCLSNSVISLMNIIRSCIFLKPVEIYYLLECLQELGCVRMLVYNVESSSLFSEPSYVEAVSAEVTDAFEDIYVETDNLAVIKFGTLLNKKMKEFDFPSDESKKYGTF